MRRASRSVRSPVAPPPHFRPSFFVVVSPSSAGGAEPEAPEGRNVRSGQPDCVKQETVKRRGESRRNAILSQAPHVIRASVSRRCLPSPPRAVSGEGAPSVGVLGGGAAVPVRPERLAAVTRVRPLFHPAIPALGQGCRGTLVPLGWAAACGERRRSGRTVALGSNHPKI
ncbi:hypothetical protein HPB47_012635 [Ixodes persulcatus]|uniref:Uncharacterized protein n=1 Tax=Ixodes persulcatus TaxID=34615 RepID=A0AC60NSY1_IXOPE|nr:hypothetical protein HPB47_012635 [Ixodes persulcatus]